ncbi:heterokaryon incompatibility protein-domain-containing protein [Schizothecium vesticola]|uniref:Heterokaryon incompatibility protein-domain-containing protein n=1 Tax=Schizothecium vesticola TaxID=314040 RepID=A0AA40EX99_9PEZI|nr:heterokaryon incompatibility protein-domain-containing protein [Schizothecium vesticola]
MGSDGESFDWGDGQYVGSEEDEYAHSGDDDDEFDLQGFLDDDAFDAPKCSNLECRDTNIHSSGSLSICLKCRSVQSSGATVSTADAFPYHPLVEASELRLLLVWPPSDNEDPIHCSLIHGRLGFGIEYDAVSYTWADETGNDSKSKTVFINNLALHVTATCEAVLKRARLNSTAKVLWIDAVCINQADTNERGHQVRLMPDIYSHAKNVLIFPGEATDKESRGLYYLPELERFLSPLATGSLNQGDQDDQPGLDILTTVQHTIEHLFSRRYFTRVWILQEIALARNPIVMYGAYEVPWNTIRTKIARSLELNTVSSSRFHHTRPLLPPEKPLPRALALGTASVRGPSDLLDLLDKARSSQAHDARDKVFALFGMIPFASRFGLVADYNQSVGEAYARVAVLLAAQSGLLPILARTIGTTPRRALASWAPDWSNPGWYKVDKTLSKTPKLGILMEPSDRIRSALASPTKIPVLARPNDYEMDFIGAWVCDLGTLFYASLSVLGDGIPSDLDVFTPTQGVFSLKARSDLDALYRALDLPMRGSLCCYLPKSPTDTANYRDEEHLKRELGTRKYLWAADLFHPRHSYQQWELILSSGRNDFCFAGLCVVTPSMVTRVLNDSISLGNSPPTPNELLRNNMRSVLSKEIQSLIYRHRLAVKPDETPADSEHSTATFEQTIPYTPIGPLLAITAAETWKGPIKSNPPGLLGREDDWLKAWADRELRFLDDFFQTAEGRKELCKIEAEVWLVVNPEQEVSRTKGRLSQGGSDCKAVRRGCVDGRERRLRKVQTVPCTVCNRVFYKELEEGACKIVDGNMTLLA